MAAAITPEQVLRKLQSNWSQLASDQTHAGGVLKACSMTLVVTAPDQADAEDVQMILGALMHDHPSRALVIWRNNQVSDAGGSLDAREFAKCFKPFGRNEQICSEGIEVMIGTARMEEVARFILPLRVPDLPVVLWCRGALDQTYMYRTRFNPLYALAGKIIFDSYGVADAEAAIEFLRGQKAAGNRIADLHWTRLTGWREVLASMFDDAALRPEDVKSVKVGYTGADPATCARYYAAWIRSSLPGVPVSLVSEPRSPGSGQPSSNPGLHSVSLRLTNDELRISQSDSGLAVDGCSRSHQAPLPSTSVDALMREELRILGPDAVWDRVLATNLGS
jgi:glucose-6-phosphate dehydrogenase assembly protein OpcA